MATNINVRLSDDEAKVFERFRRELQKKHGPSVRVTQKTVFIEALSKLGKAIEQGEISVTTEDLSRILRDDEA